MPLKMFWSFQKQIDRLNADDELRSFQSLSLACSQAADENTIKTYISSLKERIGNPAYAEAVFDEAKFQQLAAKFGQKVVTEDGEPQANSST